MAKIILTNATRLAINDRLEKNAARQTARRAKKEAMKQARNGAYVYDPLKNHKTANQ